MSSIAPTWAAVLRAGALAGLCLPLQCAGQETPTGEARFLSQVRQLTYEGRRSGEGYFSPDGQALIFQSEREPENPFYQIYVLDLRTGQTQRVSPGVGKTTCAFFRPRSDEVLFASTHLDPEAPAKQRAELEFRASGQTRRYSWDYDEHFDLFAARRDGSGLRRLTHAPGYDAEAAFSPDGRKIVFTSLRDAYPVEKLSAEQRRRLDTDPAYFAEIYLMNADGSDVRRLTHAPGYDGGPFFSPDGRRILWRRFDEQGTTADLYTMKLDGSDVRRLTDFGCMAWAPFFHPSGRYVIFTANKLGFANFELFLVDAAGRREPVRVTTTEGFDGLPVFSPDGQQLCWTSNRTPDGQSQLFLANWNHKAALRALKQAPPRRGPAAPATEPRPPQPTPVHPAAPQPNASRRPLPTPRAQPPKFSPQITSEDLRAQVEFLASDALEGRMTGSAGAQRAAAYIADALRQAGIPPLDGLDGYFQQFEFTAGIRVQTNATRLSIQREGAAARDFTPERDFRPLSFTANGEVEGEVVFAGYGLVVPGPPPVGYDSYAGLDVTNKIVLVLRYVPEGVEAMRRQELNRFASLRYKAMVARERGAQAVLIVTGPNSPNAGELAPLSFDASMAGSGILAASVSGEVAAALLEGSGQTLQALQRALDTENPHAATGFLLPKVRVRLATAVEHLRQTDRNVLGYLPPADGEASSPEVVLVGAHYDHLGFGDTGAMNHPGEEHQIHNGADDNASGVAAVLELAHALAAGRATEVRPASRRSAPSPGRARSADRLRSLPAASGSGGHRLRRGVLFAFWSGEELGLIGSSHFVEHPPLPLSNVVAYVNFDMVGRLRDNRLSLQGVGSSPAWRRLIEQQNVLAGFNLALQEDPYLPTDVTAFYPKAVPVLSFFTGSHEDYHRPSDDADRLNYDGLRRLTQFARGLVVALATTGARPAYATVARASSGGSRDSLRAYLGTIPDYTTEVTGVKLAGVRPGSPAEQAGLRAGDILIEFAGQQIKNIYDYTYALDAVKIGQPVTLVVLRAGERVSLRAIPEARK
jgi:Tol biopolymer transport system component